MRTYLQRYSLERDVSPGYVSQIRYALDRFAAWRGAEPAPGDMNDESFNRWIVAMLAESISRQTVKAYRRHLLVLWRAAFEDGVCPNEPRRIRKVKAELPSPDSPAPSLVRQMVFLSQSYRGVFKHSRVPRAAALKAFVLTNWDTGLRLGDMLRLKRQQIPADGRFTVMQHKTGWPVACRLWPETLAAIDDTFPPEREFIFGDALCLDQWQKYLRALRTAAGVTIPGGAKLLRRASATAVEIATPGGAMHHLGHKTPGLAMRHYVNLLNATGSNLHRILDSFLAAAIIRT